ncbi:hypothetical protein CKO51_03770 [Rhodopirellula sp. SM50]|nr:Uma2 family endonuclease [Rhodopirellula sp. SM50]PAY20868.1 hypothetical protein CKO51_03770 [Rhodopirellula sp. SM50]
MSSAPRYVPHYTIEDYRRWEGDWELIDGVPVSMSPSSFGPHKRVVAELSRQILNPFIENQRDYLFDEPWGDSAGEGRQNDTGQNDRRQNDWRTAPLPSLRHHADLTVKVSVTC